MRVLITGAVDGLGRALTERLLAQGDDVVLIDHNRTGLHTITQANVGRSEGFVVDLAVIEQVEKFCQTANFARIDMAIFCAGISATGKFEEIPNEAYLQLVNINLKAPLVMASQLAGHDRINRGGRIVFISSLSNDVGYPGASVYGATKEAIASYARSISRPLRKKKISVTTVFPGPMRTAHAEKHAPAGSSAAKRADPKVIAEAILKGAKSRKRELHPGTSTWLAAKAGRIAPGAMTRLMRRVIFEKLDGPSY